MRIRQLDSQNQLAIQRRIQNFKRMDALLQKDESMI